LPGVHVGAETVHVGPETVHVGPETVHVNRFRTSSEIRIAGIVGTWIYGRFMTSQPEPAAACKPSPEPSSSPGIDSIHDLGSQIVASAGRLSAATCAWLLLVAQFDAEGGADTFGLPSTAAWLAHACGLARRTATDHVRVARTLAANPLVASEMAAGRLSFSHVRAISRVLGKPVTDLESDDRSQGPQSQREPAEAIETEEQPTPEVTHGPRAQSESEPELAADLVEIAQHGTVAHLETVVRGLRLVDESDDVDSDPLDTVSTRWDDRGRWRLAAQLRPDRGAVIDDVICHLMGAGVGALTRPEALLRMAEIALVAINDGDERVRGIRADERAAVIIHIDADRVLHPMHIANAEVSAAQMGAEKSGSGESRPYGHIENGPGLSDALIRRLTCAGRVRTVVHGDRTRSDATIVSRSRRSAKRSRGPRVLLCDDRRVLDVGRSHRLVTDRQYRALMIRDQGCCTYPGCSNTKFLEAHHVIHWLDDGRTDLANMALLCSRHHDSHHDGTFAMFALPNGEFGFVLADGSSLARPDVAPLMAGLDGIEKVYATVATDAAGTRWSGERLDRHYAISGLATNRQRARADRRAMRRARTAERPESVHLNR
jgi:hypothetical protein